MGTKKTMLVLACALVMVFAMSTCAFAFGDYNYSEDINVVKVGVDVDCWDIDTTLNNSNNEGVILQGSNSNSIVAIDDITATLDIYTLYSGNTGSFNTMVMDANNVTVSDSYNNTSFTFTSFSNVGSFNDYDVDVTDSFNYTSSVSGSYADESFDFDMYKSFNGADLINYNDSDLYDYDDNDLLDLDAAIFVW